MGVLGDLRIIKIVPRGTQMYPQDVKMEAPGLPNHPSKIRPGVLESWYWGSSRTPSYYALSLLHLQDVKMELPGLQITAVFLLLSLQVLPVTSFLLGRRQRA